MPEKNTAPYTRAFSRLALLLLLCTGCKTKQPVVNQEPGKPLYHLLVSFYSIGTGVDAGAISIMDNIIRDYQENRGLPVVVEKIPWGREGEVDYCIDLKKLTETDQKEFINKTKQQLSSSTRVHIYENAVCRYKKD